MALQYFIELLFYAGVVNSHYSCLTWELNGQNLSLICRTQNQIEPVSFIDSKGNLKAKCTLNNPSQCKTFQINAKTTANTYKNEVVFMINDYERKQIINDEWTCSQGNRTLKTVVSASKGILSDTDLTLSLLHSPSLQSATLICVSCRAPHGNHAEFLIDDKSVDSIRYNMVTGKCTHMNGKCLPDKCSCIPSGNEFTRMFPFIAINKTKNFSCRMKFVDNDKSSIFSMISRVSYNGQEFIYNGTETIISKPPINDEKRNVSDDRNNNRTDSNHDVADAGKILYWVVIGVAVTMPCIVAIIVKLCCRSYKNTKKGNDGNEQTLEPLHPIGDTKLSEGNDGNEQTLEPLHPIGDTELSGEEDFKLIEAQCHVNQYEKRQQFIHELFLKGECGKLHFARLVLIGKNGVGKTSLMRRLLWQNKEDVTSTQSTDGIEVEKCNINIKDGKWSKCDKSSDALTRLIHQIYEEKTLNEESYAVENVVDENHFGSDTHELRQVSVIEPYDVGYDTGSLFEDINSESFGSNDSLEIYPRRTNINSIMSKHIDTDHDNETVETNINQIQPEKINFQNEYDRKKNSNETESDQVNDEDINQMTSTIIKSSLQLRERKHNDMLAFCWLWDFAGQKDFYATHQVFLSNCAVYLLVTDSLNFTTTEEPGINFEDSTQYVRFWFDAIHCYWSTTKRDQLDPPIIVVCTNEDKFKDSSERQKRREQFQENLSKVLKNQKKKRHLRNIYFVSNTEDDDDVFDEIRNGISREAMDMTDWGRTCPLKWLLFQQVLGKLKESGVSISTTTKLFEIANHDDIGITKDEEFKLCLQYCHDNGTVIYFDEENLQDHVILDPKWLVDAFRCLVSDKIETVIKISDHWQKLTETGELTEKLITDLFKKEPKLHFLENKSHLLEVMKRFDILVNLKNSSALYMPCMMKPCTFEEVRKQFIDESQSFYRTSWLCLDFRFLPPAFFNHILAWYIKQYSVSVITEKGTRNVRKALYRQIGVFNLDLSGCEQLVVCEGPNVIALQVWNSRISDKTYGDLRKKLCKFVDSLLNRYRLKITFTKSFKCKDGDFTINRQKMNILVTEYYRCLEHKTNHISEDLVQPWYVREEIRILP